MAGLVAAPAALQAARARARPAATGTVQGIVSAIDGTIKLGGAMLTVAAGDVEVARAFSDGDGSYRIDGIPPGRYTVSAMLRGFEVTKASVQIGPGAVVELTIDMALASVSEQVEVVAPATTVPSSGTLTSTETVSAEEIDQIVPGGGLPAALRLLVGVIQVPGGVAIKGGRPSQASTQLGVGLLVDPATGLSQVSLPDDAIDSVTVLPNPYAVEYGRFSSGLVLIQTRRAADRWRTRVNKLDPSFRVKRHQPFTIVGLSSFLPRFETGGPLVKDRVFLQQSAQFRYRTSDVPSRPQDELKRLRSFSSFTRVDANLSSRHSLVAAGGLFPSVSTYSTLGTFIPPNATVDQHNGETMAAVTERSFWSEAAFSETTVQVRRSRTEVLPQGAAVMELLPETTLGNFFNRQDRATTSYQLVHSLSGTRHGGLGLHLYKVGLDVLHSQFDGTSASNDVLVRRGDGTLARRLTFGGPTAQSYASTDVAVFVQDRLQPTTRWYVEFGGRLDRDGVIDRFNLTPRVGSAVLLNQSGSAVIRGGYGLFYERTPSAAGTFASYESPTETRYAADGSTPLSAPVQWVHETAPNLQTPRSLTWDIAYDHRFSPKWAVHASVIDRHGTRELLLDPVAANAPSERSALRISSKGQSRYRELELGVHFTGSHGLDVNGSYVRSQARADLNSFTSFYDTVLWPIVGVNQYAPARADAPHRLLLRARATPSQWLFIGLIDWRTGLPYSVVDDALDFIGPRNAQRFPNYVRIDIGVERRVRLFMLHPWVGVRAENAFNHWLPSDVQANISSPAFGTFYNSEYRQFRIQFRFAR